MKRISSFTLAAVVLLTFVHVSPAAEKKHNFAQWEKEIEAFEASDRTNPPPMHGILFTGSSGIRKWTTLAQDFPGQPVFKRGVGGCEIVDITHFADRIVFPYQPKMIVLRCGGNDIANGKSAEEVFDDYKDFVKTIRAKLPDTDIVYVSWNATPLRWSQRDKERTLNKLVRAYNKTFPHLEYCNGADFVLDENGKPRMELFAPDRLHFSPEGYKLLTQQVRPFLPKS